MPGVRTKVGGESSAPSYGYLLGKLSEIFDPTSEGVNAYEVVRSGFLWYVKAGIINDPKTPWHEYGIEYRQTQRNDGTLWYESEMCNGDGETALAFSFAPHEAYLTSVYVPKRGAELCFSRATEAHYAGTLAVITHTMYSEQASFAAAQRFEQVE